MNYGQTFLIVMTISANAMSYTQAREEALFLSDKMAYELNLTAAQYDAVYEINLDYIMSVDDYSDVFGVWWDRRNSDLRYALSTYQYEKYLRMSYFYRPMTWTSGSWHFAVHNRYVDRTHFYNPRPTVYVSYRGGNNHRPANHYAGRVVNKPIHTTVTTHNNYTSSFHRPNVNTTVTRTTTHTVTTSRTDANSHFGNPQAHNNHNDNSSRRTAGTFGGRR